MDRRSAGILGSLVVVAGAVVLGLAGTAGIPPPAGDGPRGEPCSPPPPAAILTLGPWSAPGEVVAVRADGGLRVLSLEDGRLLRTLETGALAWGLRFRHGEGEHHGHHCTGAAAADATVLAGIPVAAVEGRVVAAVGTRILEWGGTGESRVLLADPRIGGARLLVHGGPGTPVFAALADDSLIRLDGDGVFAGRPAPGGRPTALALAGPHGPLLVGGTGERWHILDGESLRVRQAVPLREVAPPVTAMALAADGTGLLVAHGLCRPVLESFTLGPGGAGRRQGRGGGFTAKGPGATALALQPGGRIAAVGRAHGGWGVSFLGGGFHGAGGSGEPLRAVRFLRAGSLLLIGTGEGLVRALSFPGEEVAWDSPPSPGAPPK